MPSINRVTLLYGVGIVLGVAATAYFGFQLLEDLSPATTSLLLLLGFVGFALAGLGVEAETLDTVLYALAAGSYLVFVGYTLAAFELGDGAAFLLLAGSSGLFIALGYLAHEGRLALERRYVRIGLVIVSLLGVFLVAVDVTGAQPTHDEAFEESVEIPAQGDAVRLGTITVENGFLLPREAEIPRYSVCIYPGRDVAPLRYEPRSTRFLLSGGESWTTEVVLDGRIFYDDGERREPFADVDSLSVERADDCPADTEEPTLVVTSQPRPTPV